MAKREDENMRRATLIALGLLALVLLSGVLTPSAPITEQKVVQTSGVVEIDVVPQPVTESGIVKVGIQKAPTS